MLEWQYYFIPLNGFSFSSFHCFHVRQENKEGERDRDREREGEKSEIIRREWASFIPLWASELGKCREQSLAILIWEVENFVLTSEWWFRKIGIMYSRQKAHNGHSKINHFLSVSCEGPKRTQVDDTYPPSFQLPQLQGVYSGWVKVTQCSHVSPGSI